MADHLREKLAVASKIVKTPGMQVIYHPRIHKR